METWKQGRGWSMDLEKYIVGATGIGYLICGVLQLKKGSIPNFMIWTGYAFAQTGLWLTLK
jgi:hypothetical protein